MKPNSITLMLTGIAVLPTVSAQATPVLPAATFYLDNVQVTGPGKLQGLFSNTSWSDSIIAGVKPVVNSSVTAAPGGSGYKFTQAVLNFSFEILGPDHVWVPVDVNSSGSATATNGGAVAFFNIGIPPTYNNGGYGIGWAACYGFTQGYCPTMVENQASFSTAADGPMLFPTNAPIAVTLSTLAYVNGAAAAHAAAMVDPMFTISSSVTDASLYSIVYSPGLELPVSVPEPATLGLFAAGLIGFAASARRRHGKSRRSCGSASGSS